MKEWALKILISVLILSSISIILPTGKLSSYIKYVFAIILIPIVIEPVLMIKNNNFDFNTVFNETEVQVQNDYLDYISEQKINEYNSRLNVLLNNLGVLGAKVDLLYNIDENYIIHIKKVCIDLTNSVINSDKEHIDIIETIKTAYSEYLHIDKDEVIIYE
ncbi:MAG: hypothetical protein E7373_03510 [Clostridiales bacterium]|nr:hypothetical protein [Clostridiales bacterium]